jgi:hypothetical protein
VCGERDGTGHTVRRQIDRRSTRGSAGLYGEVINLWRLQYEEAAAWSEAGDSNPYYNLGRVGC